MIHELKTLPKFFNAALSGEKTFEVRANDRPFKKGDLLAMNEYDADGKSYTGRSCLVYIDYILNNEDYCKSGYVVMSIKPCVVRKVGGPVNHYKLAEDYSIPLATEADVAIQGG